MLRSARVAVLMAMIVASLTLSGTTPVAACVSRPAPFDSFSSTVPHAGTIVIGTVERPDKDQRYGRFRLRVDEVLRGRAPAAMRFATLSGSDARSACGDRNSVVVRHGDRLALAMRHTVKGRPLKVDAVAFVGGSKPDRFQMPRIEQLSTREVRRLAGQAVDGSTVRRPHDAGWTADNIITDKIAPGISRVSARGTRHDLGAIRRLDVSEDGRVWAATTDTAFVLAQGLEYRPRDHLPGQITDISVGPGGFAYIDGWPFDALFEEGRGWARHGPNHPAPGARPSVMPPSGPPDGLSERGPWRLDDDGWTRWATADPATDCDQYEGRARRLDCEATRRILRADGGYWQGSNSAGFGELRRFDGTTSTHVPRPLGVEAFAVTHMASFPGGPVWALLVLTDPTEDPKSPPMRLLARWDGEAWTHFELPRQLVTVPWRGPRELVAGPNGIVWLSHPLASFDGETWRLFDVPARKTSKDPRIEDISVSSDGSTWLVVRDHVKSRTTRPDGIYIMDPARSKVAVERAAVIREPALEATSE